MATTGGGTRQIEELRSALTRLTSLKTAKWLRPSALPLEKDEAYT